MEIEVTTSPSTEPAAKAFAETVDGPAAPLSIEAVAQAEPETESPRPPWAVAAAVLAWVDTPLAKAKALPPTSPSPASAYAETSANCPLSAPGTVARASESPPLPRSTPMPPSPPKAEAATARLALCVGADRSSKLRDE